MAEVSGIFTHVRKLHEYSPEMRALQLEKILALVANCPKLGAKKLSDSLIHEGVHLSPSAIRNVLVKHNLNRRSLRKTWKDCLEKQKGDNFMKSIIMLMCAIIVAATVVPVFASQPNEEKKNHLVYEKGCPNLTYSLPERISKLKAEIDKGENIYTLDELKLLERRLKEDNATMRALNKPGGR